ncbi:type II secretion system protein [Fusobacterium periodonticum]|uniref:type IV pilus modification PilV family protein n=1 Tax=Fusobacterium periodonticum TaxID=860 RepID=UPI0028D0AC30|nr:type II secretion system protein [Fusobacterium periodonticum]
MKKSRAFSLMEVIMSVFILFLVLIPSVKLNNQQLKTYSEIREKEKELHFFNSLNNYLKSKSISNNHLEFNSYSDFINSFNDFQTYTRNMQSDEFKLLIDVEDIEVDFFDRKEKISLISLEYKGASKSYKNKIIKFKD